MNWNKLDWDQMPADAGQTVSVEYSVDWESSTIYRKSHDRSDSTVAVEQAEITGGEYEPQNGILPEHGEWRPADADTAAAAGRGLHYQSAAWAAIALEVDWTNCWPAIDRDGNLTGQAVEAAEASAGDYWNVDDEAMISDEEARAGGWEIGADDGYATPPEGYAVRMNDAVENTGLDSAVFPTREDAEAAAAAVNEEYPRARAEVVSSKAPPTTTFAQWHSQPW